MKKFWAGTTGVTLVEYGIAIGLAVSVGTASFVVLSGAITNQLGAASAELTN